ncbi:MAG: protein BatD [Flavobacteriales bacterium]|nr:protein BatD [Flavobacteriales bacterium]
MKLFLSISILLLFLSSYGQVTFTGKVSASDVATGQQFKLIFETNTKGLLTPPNLVHFEASGPMQGSNSSISYVNGVITKKESLSYTYILRASKAGEYTIGSATLEAGGKTYKTNPIKVKVSKGSTTKKVSPKENENLFGRITLSKKKIVIGEHVIATVKVYSKYNRLNLSDAEYPMASGFWNEEIKAGSKGWPTKTERINGALYNVFTIKKDLLYPQKSGTLSIPAFSIELIANRSFFNAGTTFNITSNSPSIEVTQIPNAPTNFSGLVGSFTMKADISKTELSADEGIDVHVKIKGKGNLQQLDKLNFEFPLDFDTYDPETEQKISSSTSGISGSKTFNYLSIPRSGGEFKVGPVEVVYYHIKTKSFKTLSSETWDVKVEKSGQEGSASLSSTDQQNVELLSEGIRHIRLETELLKKEDLLYGTGTFWTLLFSPIVLFIGFIFVQRKRKANPKDESVEKVKKAGRTAIKALEGAKEGLVKNDANQFNEAMLNGLFGYLNNKLGLEMAHMNKSAILESILKNGGNEATAGTYISIIEQCEMARYAPITESSSEEIYQKGIEIIEKLENELAI